MADKSLWGIDLGGTKIEGIVLAGSTSSQTVPSHTVLCRERIATEGDQGYDHVLDRIKTLLDLMVEATGDRPELVGFGTPGTLDPDTGTLRGSNSVHLNGRPLDRDLERLLGLPVVLANDANCFALAETRAGVVPEVCPQARVVSGLIIGTGVGSGIVVDGKTIVGRHAIAGEWGHNFLDESGGPCFCGRTGCVETVISGPALEKFYLKSTGMRLSLEDIADRSGHDDAARATMDRLVTYFGRSVATLINILDPDVMVVGGGVGNIDCLYDRGKEEIARHLFAPELKTIITRPKLGDSAGVYGAAYLTESVV